MAGDVRMLAPSRELLPCKEGGVICPLREPGCRSSCERYATWEAEVRRVNGNRWNYNIRKGSGALGRFDPGRCHKGLREDGQ